MAQSALGVCYYPEHWSKSWWQDDAKRMRNIGLSYVRIGEFAWSRMEPDPGVYDWEWLDDAIQTLGQAGLKVILCTPTPTPPKWLTDRFPQVLRHDERGQAIKHGSRRHVSVASATYRRLSNDITAAMAARYGNNPHIAGWQTDNEFGCHDSTLSYGPEDCDAFQDWLRAKYENKIERLNLEWGNAFWSMTYRSFEEIDLPNQLQCEANPAHWMEFRRFFSDMTVGFNRDQCEIIRALAPSHFITHNCMFTEGGFDHWDLAEDLDFLSWDSYPLGFLRQAHEFMPELVSEDEVSLYQHIGHPDLLGFTHDMYRSMGPDKFWVMEQQPGPVNWASQNVAPIDGGVRFWTLEAMSHGAEVVAYFRWRQAPWSQEQMHTGLNTAWNEPDQAALEAEQVAQELSSFDFSKPCRNPKTTVGIYFDFESIWFFEALRQGDGMNPWAWALQWYQAARSLGWNIEFFGPKAQNFESIKDLQLLLVPTMPIAKPALITQLIDQTNAHIVFGPRSGSRTEHLAFETLDELDQDLSRSAPSAPPYLRDAKGTALFPGLTVPRVESLPQQTPQDLTWGNSTQMQANGWIEHLRVKGDELTTSAQFKTGPGLARQSLSAAAVCTNRATYLGFHPSLSSMQDMLRKMAGDFGLDVEELGPSTRRRRTKTTSVELDFAVGGKPGANIKLS